METQQKTPEAPKTNKSTMYIVGGVVLAIVVIMAAFFLLKGKKGNTPVQTKKMMQEEEQIIPTVDSSVTVKISPHPDKKKFDMSVEGIPANTTSLEYEITYQTAKGGLPGYSSMIDIKADQAKYEKKDFLLGTCSTGGTCTYDEVVGPLKVNIKFSGSYGDKLFSKDFDL